VTELFYPEEYIERNKRRNPIVKDIFGEDRYTLGQFLSFRTSFEKKISKSKGTFINATEGGIPIEGMKIMRLKDYIEEYCNVPFLDNQALLESFETKKPAYDLEGLITGILRDKSKLRIVRKNASKIIECVTRLKELKEKRLHNTDEESRLIQRISHLEVRVKNPVVKIVDPYRSRMENYIWRDECDEVALDLIQDSLDYYSELIKVIDRFILKVEELLVILKRESEVDQIMADENNSVIDKYFRVGVIHRDIGLVRQSVTDFEKVANEFSRLSDSDSQLKYWPTAISAFSALAELYAKQQRFSEARKILDTLSEFVSNENSNTQSQSLDQGTIQKLMESCKEGMAAWEEKKQLMVSLLREAENNYGSYLESGSFYYRIGDHDRSVREYLKSVEDTRALLLKRNISNSTDANIIIRLLSTYYGLAQTYRAMGKQKEAISALDSGCKEIEKLDRFDLPGILEEFSALIVDLYVCLNEREKALSFGQQMFTIFPNGTKMKVKLQTIMAQGSTRLIAAQG